METVEPKGEQSPHQQTQGSGLSWQASAMFCALVVVGLLSIATVVYFHNEHQRYAYSLGGWILEIKPYLTGVEGRLNQGNTEQTSTIIDEIRKINTTVDLSPVTNELGNLEEDTISLEQEIDKLTREITELKNQSNKKTRADKFYPTGTPYEPIRESDMETRNLNNYTENSGNFTRCFKDRWTNSTTCMVPVGDS